MNHIMLLAWARRLRLGLQRGRLDLTWITPDWAVGAAPPPGLLPAVVQAGISSLLDLRAEASPDPRACGCHGLRRLHLPVPDGQAPSQDQFAQGTAWVLSEVAAGRRVLIYCHAGSGRSVILACAVLLVMGYPLSQTLPLVARRRTVAQPTEAQVAALQRFATSRGHQR